jgi:diacylglycerol kinase (ATP)
MRVMVVHNPTAGENIVTKDALLAALRDAGHDTVYLSTKDRRVPSRVQEPRDLLLAAGGDGTVRKVALEIADADTPIVVVPLGTANNIGRCLGMPRNAEEIIRSIPSLREVAFDVGRIGGHWGQRRFIEAVGFGVFAEVMAVAKKHAPAELARTLGADAEIVRDLRLFKAVLALHKPAMCRIEIDGDVIEQKLLLLEVMNIPTIGPNLRFAPHADPGDGAFDVAIAAESARAELAAYVEDRIAGRNTSAPELLLRRARRLRIRWHSPLAHVDDAHWAARGGSEEGVAHSFEITLAERARRFLAS